MKKRTLDMAAGIAIFAITTLAVWFYFRTMEQEKTTARVELYELVAPHPEALLVINRPKTFSNTLLPKTPVHDMLAGDVPEVFLRIAAMNQISSPLFISLHTTGAVLYAKTDSELRHRIRTTILEPFFNTYAPQRQQKGKINFTYYPDTGNRFFGFYEYEGAFVASYSKKLLEEVATQQQRNDHTVEKNINDFRKQSDKNAPMNLLVSSDPLNLYVPIDDSTAWVLQDQWFTVDVFTSESGVCCHGSLPYKAEYDSLYAPMADTLSQRLNMLFRPMQFRHEISHDGQHLYYTGCQNSTLKPSYE